MPERLRSIVNRLREFAGNRRRAPRVRVRLEVELELGISSRYGTKQGARDAGKELRLAGHTRDISRSGLALILPAIHIGGQYVTDNTRTLRITLKLPNGPVKLRAMPVRYTQLDEDAGEAGYLVGVQITEMSDDARARFNAHIEMMNAE
jgi:hypothetical protein